MGEREDVSALATTRSITNASSWAGRLRNFADNGAILPHFCKCLDVQNGSTASGANIVQNTCSSANSQKVTLETVPGSRAPSPRVLRFKHSNLCLMVKNQATANLTSIVQAACPGSGEVSKGFDFVE